MRPLDSEEQALIERRRAGFDAILHERIPVLIEFMERLEMPNPAHVLDKAETYLPSLDSWMQDQVVDVADRVWILTRLAYFIGEYLVQRQGGYWFLNEIPDSRYFGRYVVGGFSRSPNLNLMTCPFHAAGEFLNEPAGSSLTKFLNEIEDEIRQT